jgi:hypothetical protein
VSDDLEDYLRGDSPLSRQYQRESAPLPPGAVDRAVLAAAQEFAGERPRSRSSARSPRLAPLAFAASVLLSMAMLLAIVVAPRSSKRADEAPHVTPVRLYSSGAPRQPAAWLSDIRALRRSGRNIEAEQEMRRFHATYPRYEVNVGE